MTPHAIVETFSGTSIDFARTWSFWGTNQPNSVQFSQANGAMNIDIAASAQNDFNAGGATRCMAHGDFDALVDFKLPLWPSADGIWLLLQMSGTPLNVYRVTWQFQPSEAYGAYFPPSGTAVPGTGTAGTLRLSRHGDLFTGYYLDGLRWIPVLSGVGPTDDAGITIAVANISGASPFLGLPATVRFDNLVVLAKRVVCP